MNPRHMLISRERQRFKAIDGAKAVTGAYFTRNASWLTAPVRAFLEEHTATNRHVLDPFAGDGDILDCLRARYDIKPGGYDLNGPTWPNNDSLRYVPNPHRALICTNPPYLAKHSARRKGLWDDVHQYYGHHHDLYELAIEKSMADARAGIFIVPETFLHSRFPKSDLRLASVILGNPFTDTEHPVCVACFDRDGVRPARSGRIFVGDDYACHISAIDRSRFRTGRSRSISFNRADGNIALKAIDGTDPADRIRFARPDAFSYESSRVKVSSRLLTYIRVDELDDACLDGFLSRANHILADLRQGTSDLLLSPFKGNDRQGRRRRRLDYALARYIIATALGQMDSCSLRPGNPLQAGCDGSGSGGPGAPRETGRHRAPLQCVDHRNRPDLPVPPSGRGGRL